MSDEGKESIKIVWMLLKVLDFVSEYGIIDLVTRGNTMRPFSIRFPDDLLEAAKRAAKDEDRTFGQQVRRLVREWLRRREQQEQEQEVNDDSNREPNE